MSSMSMCLQTLPSSLMSMYPFWPTPKLFQMPRKYSSSTVKESLFAVILFNSPKMITICRMFYHGIIHKYIILTLPNYAAFVNIRVKHLSKITWFVSKAIQYKSEIHTSHQVTIECSNICYWIYRRKAFITMYNTKKDLCQLNIDFQQYMCICVGKCGKY